jgi:hypothetical protein
MVAFSPSGRSGRVGKFRFVKPRALLAEKREQQFRQALRAEAVLDAHQSLQDDTAFQEVLAAVAPREDIELQDLAHGLGLLAVDDQR